MAKAAQILNLEPYLERYPRELSGGQRQRVAMGRAIVRDPKVFLFDEPLSNLDAKLRVAMRAEIKALHQRLKTTTVYVTHDQIEAMTMADRIVVMHDGVIEQIGTPLELYDRPDNLFVAQFIGSPAMNIVQGTLRRDERRRASSRPRTACAGRSARRRRTTGQAVAYGVRPDHLELAPTRNAACPGEIVVVEPTGVRNRAGRDASARRRSSSRRTGGATLQPGDKVDLHRRSRERAPVRPEVGAAADGVAAAFVRSAFTSRARYGLRRALTRSAPDDVNEYRSQARRFASRLSSESEPQ